MFSDSTKTDTSIFPKKQGGKCYVLQIRDACGTSPSVRACPTYIDQAEETSAEQNTLKWTDPVNGDGDAITSYQIEFYGDGKQIKPAESIGKVNTITFDIDTSNQVIVYRITGFLPDGTAIRSALIPVRQYMRIFVPTAFTPGNDGQNDVFIPKGLFWNEYEMDIYNRWGQNVFSTTDRTKGWDGGQFNPDVYQVVIKVKDQFGEEKVERKKLQLIR